MKFTQHAKEFSSARHWFTVCLLCFGAAVMLCWSVWIVFAANRTWTGGTPGDFSCLSPNPAWTNPCNWAGKIVPVAGDDLIFGSSIQLSSVNNFANGTTFNSLSVSGGHQMSGNSVSLNAGLTAANALINLSSLKLNNSLTFTAPTAAISATIQSTIDTNGKTLSVAGPGNFIFFGIIGGSGGLTKTGSGLTKLAGGNVYTGQTEVDDGTLLVLGSQSSSSVIVKDGGTLGGDGAVGPVQMLPLVQGGTISPGDINHDSGILTAGSVSFPAAKISNFNVDLNGTTVGSGYDQLNVFGTVSLGSSGAAALCSLNLTLGFTPTPGATFIIVKNVGTDSISGEFAGKPEGSSFAVNGTTFFITYKGGDGNDVALRVPDTWDGGGTTNNWTEAANWLGDVAPTAGAILIFPDSAARKANTNDFPHDTNFGSITVTGKGYQINGNSITLSNGITVNTPIGLGPTFGPSITLTQPQTFTNIGTQTFRLDGQLNLNGFGVTVDGTNNYNFNGKVTGAGGIIKNGSGTLFIEGQFNNYTGVTQLNGGTLQLHSGLGATGAGNDTVINSGSMFLNNVTIPEAITLNGGELGAIACNAGCAVTGAVTLTADSTIQVTGFSILTVNSVTQLFAEHTLTKTGPGTLILTGTSTHSATNITAGTLLVNGLLSGFIDINGGTLGGTGTVNRATANSGSISPGASPGTLSTGNVTFSANSSFVVEIGGLAQGAQYDLLNANGNVALNGANLSASLINGFVPGAGDQFTIIQSSGNITGTFAQGNSITIGGKAFSIIYSPNSVVLKAANSNPPYVFVEEGTVNRALALDSVTFVRGPFKILDDHNFSADHHTRVIIFTSNLGLTQPNPAVLTVQAAGVDLTVENVGPVMGVIGLNASYIVVRLSDGLPPGDLPLTVVLNGNMSNIATLSISP